MTVVAEDLAAHGYVALAVDHPGDAAMVELAGGGSARWTRLPRRTGGLQLDPHGPPCPPRRRSLPARPPAGAGPERPAPPAARPPPCRDGRPLARRRHGSRRHARDRRLDAGVTTTGCSSGAAAQRAVDRPFMTMTGRTTRPCGRSSPVSAEPRPARQVAGAGRQAFTDYAFLAPLLSPSAMPMDLGRSRRRPSGPRAARLHARSSIATCAQRAPTICSPAAARAAPAVTVAFARSVRLSIEARDRGSASPGPCSGGRRSAGRSPRLADGRGGRGQRRGGAVVEHAQERVDDLGVELAARARAELGARRRGAQAGR